MLDSWGGKEDKQGIRCPSSNSSHLLSFEEIRQIIYLVKSLLSFWLKKGGKDYGEFRVLGDNYEVLIVMISGVMIQLHVFSHVDQSEQDNLLK